MRGIDNFEIEGEGGRAGGREGGREGHALSFAAPR